MHHQQIDGLYPTIPQDPKRSLFHAVIEACRSETAAGEPDTFALERRLTAASSFRMTPDALATISMFWSRKTEDLLLDGLARFQPPMAGSIWIEHDVRSRCDARLPMPRLSFRKKVIPGQVGVLLKFDTPPGATRPRGNMVVAFRPWALDDIAESGAEEARALRPVLSGAYAEFDLPSSLDGDPAPQYLEEAFQTFGDDQANAERMSNRALGHILSLYRYKFMVAEPRLTPTSKMAALASVCCEMPLMMVTLGLIGAKVLDFFPSSVGPGSAVEDRTAGTGLLDAVVNTPVGHA